MGNLLVGAFARADRAKEHLADLEARLQALGDSEENLIRYDDWIRADTLELPDFETRQPIVGVLVGEIVYNLRGTLDYLVYALARLDSGSFQEGTQFPIEDTPEGFARNARSYLNGINKTHLAQIESLQPYNGCDWTRTLRNISNPDKHRHLTGLIESATLWTQGSPSEAETETALFSGSKMDMDVTSSIEVALADGTPIVDTLQALHTEVANLLQAFEPEFKTPQVSI